MSGLDPILWYCCPAWGEFPALTMANYDITPPLIDQSLISKAEVHAAHILQASVGQLAHYVREFQAALDLFDMATFLANRNHTNQSFSSWTRLAMRDGAMTIYHFGRTLKNGDALKDCRGLRSILNHEAFRSARSRFGQKFPRAERVRHTVGHAAEMTESIANFRLNATSESVPRFVRTNGARVQMDENIQGRRYIAMHEGEVVTYELSHMSLRKLADIASEFYSGFDPVDISLKADRRRFRL